MIPARKKSESCIGSYLRTAVSTSSLLLSVRRWDKRIIVLGDYFEKMMKLNSNVWA